MGHHAQKCEIKWGIKQKSNKQLILERGNNMGQIYPAHRSEKNKTVVSTHHAWYSKEYAESRCSLYLEEELVKNKNGKFIVNYRLHAKEPHSNEDVLAYSIDCPNCNGKLKQIGINKNCYELGLFTCPSCNADKERGW